MKPVFVALSVFLALCQGHTIPWVKKQPAMKRSNVLHTIPWFTKQPAMVRKQSNDDDTQCPDKQSYCPVATTCCLLTDGFYGCCPSGADAVCCDDKKHCCPHGYQCNPATYECFKGDWSFEATVQFPSKNSRAVMCPDGISNCPAGNTCCLIGENQYGCCPTAGAVCCADRLYCCGHNYVCNATSHQCDPPHKSHQDSHAALLTPASSKDVVSNNVICPDGQSVCPDGSTCCKLTDGDWGCCPYTQAVCCTDMLHCCPNGYKCDVSAGSCVMADGSKFVAYGMVIKTISPMDLIAVDVQPNAVMCPDGKSQCPTDNTCCILNTGQWGCCPMPKAVCCSDGEHCCPNGYTCASGSCQKSHLLTDIVSTKEITDQIDIEGIICPDGRSQCPDGNTCCKLSSGQYGCCPLPNAVCCSDRLHCCPSGYTCSASTCVKSDDQLALVGVNEVVTNVVCPDYQSLCPGGSTCCKLTDGEWGCCPYTKAVCCSNGLHCCPDGYTCDIRGSSSCIMADSSKSLAFGMVIKAITPMDSIVVDDQANAIVCPDSKSQCPDGNTCCMMNSGQWGCCPEPKAVCCSDGEHCCPNGYTCASGSCQKSHLLTDIVSTKEITDQIDIEGIICPDGRSQCPDGNTCCKLSSGQYGCCPLPNAVCCSDRLHCCPSGYTCSASTCVKSDDQLALVGVNEVVTNVVCPDYQSLCPGGSTCCKLTDGEWGCCPYTKAVCCSNGLHCCPDGYTCDISSSSCIMADSSKSLAFGMVIKAITPMDSIVVDDQANAIVCPDSKSQCPDGNTCCMMNSGQWGCCPEPKAVCCSDGEHCCPHGYICASGGTTCQKPSLLTDMLSSTEITIQKDREGVICPGGQSQCPTDTTCCPLGSGQYGCCPLPNAVCCSDKKHCCPTGTTCNLSAGTCDQSGDQLALVAVKVMVNDVLCPDGVSECQDGSTCCQLASGGYGCCPYRSAVCCDDGEHCCPSGYTCARATGACTKADVLKTRLINGIGLQDVHAVPEEEEGVITCPDGQSTCRDGDTCCEINGGLWTCCPQPNAVCCDDQTHCCPEGYTCDTAGGYCTTTSPLMSTSTCLIANGVVCPDGQSTCPDGNTCCKLSSGDYGCCPMPNAVCCSDGEHCCPSGYTCDTAGGTCIKSYHQLALVAVKGLTAVVCPDGQSECPDGNTCCKLSSGEYGCCPMPNAVCCSDGEHCCPSDYTCDTAGGTCIKSYHQLALVAVKGLTAVVCPDGQSECPDGNTCCKLSSGEYGCCPMPNAVCCSDGEHCCPSGYTCDTAGGTCIKSDHQLALVAVEGLTAVVCPDGQARCPDGNTCCKLSSGEYGCCPMPNAVCCSDGEHCCPSGYTCDTAGGTCIKSDHQLALVAVKGLTAVVCPDGQSECPDGNTCCKLSSGEYGCCPMLNAVCCSDGEHCCPSGYTCDTAGGTCIKSYHQLALVAVKGLTAVVCPDGQSECPDGNTCCKLSSGEYGCCPMPNAVCCSDGEHCCPSGYTCDTAGGTCIKSDHQLALVAVKGLTAVVCPDGQSECPDGNTCCKLSSGEYGCCPMPNAVCCSDGEHCCPSGYTCDTAGGTCIKSDHQLALVAVVGLTAVVCPDSQSECPDGNTCCKLSSGQYGCCPVPNAVCCSDGEHCCPSGYTCDTAGGTCIKSDHQLALVAVKGFTVVCPDSQSECPDGNTCCKLSSGEYGCCPMPNAVCCSDGEHCCPSGYTCDTAAGTCSKSTVQLDLVSLGDVRESTIMCPDGITQCPDGFTCCKTDSGYGCCPLPNAVCCDDQLHCCPEAYQCDTSSGSCFQSADNAVTTLTLIADVESPVLSAGGDVVCPGGGSKCPESNTCCKLPDGTYGCCPLPHAVCCSDGLHCCPTGHRCDVKSAKCESSQDVIPFVRKVPARRIP